MTYFGPSYKEDDLVNHSCDPNCGVRFVNGKPWIIALKDIKKGEELTWDYSTWVDESHWGMECLCGTGICRGLILDFNRLPIEVQQKYFKLGIVAPFIIQKIFLH